MGRVGERRESGRSEPKAGAAVEIRRAKERVSEFRAPQTGESFCSCQRKRRKTFIYKGFRCFFVFAHLQKFTTKTAFFHLISPVSWSNQGQNQGQKVVKKQPKKRRKTHGK